MLYCIVCCIVLFNSKDDGTWTQKYSWGSSTIRWEFNCPAINDKPAWAIAQYITQVQYKAIQYNTQIQNNTKQFDTTKYNKPYNTTITETQQNNKTNNTTQKHYYTINITIQQTLQYNKHCNTLNKETTNSTIQQNIQ